eukprot:scaffold89401_cov36-Prasinocladus_malaysianus.AAC.1
MSTSPLAALERISWNASTGSGRGSPLRHPHRWRPGKRVGPVHVLPGRICRVQRGQQADHAAGAPAEESALIIVLGGDGVHDAEEDEKHSVRGARGAVLGGRGARAEPAEP